MKTRRPNGAGLRASIWNADRETWVSVYDGDAAGLDTDSGRWQVVCERHSTILSVDTLKQARADMHCDPDEFCEECRDEPVDLPNGDRYDGATDTIITAIPKEDPMNPRYIVRYVPGMNMTGWCVIDAQTGETIGKHGADETAAWEEANELNELEQAHA